MSDKPAVPAETAALAPMTVRESDVFEQLLLASGRDAAVVAALMTVDRDTFQWRRAMLRGDGLAAMLKRAGLPLELVEFQALLTVDRLRAEPDAVVTVGTLAQDMGLDPSRASRLAGKLIAGGYLQRGVAQSDARKVVLVLTDLGLAALDEGRQHKWARYVEIFADWQDDEITTFTALLHRYVTAMRSYDTAALKP